MLQRTGSFKVRGAFNLVLAHVHGDSPSDPVVAASGGNFAFALGYAASRLRAKAHLFVPSTSPSAKIDNVRSTGAEVTVIDGFYGDALEASRQFVAANGGLLAHAYDQDKVVEGAGTCGLEIQRTSSRRRHGGGLGRRWRADSRNCTRGPGRRRIVGVETELTPTLFEARRQGGPVDVEVGGIAVSSLGSKRFGNIAWEVSRSGSTIRFS